jgi:hypothetical protein
MRLIGFSSNSRVFNGAKTRPVKCCTLFEDVYWYLSRNRIGISLES